MRDMNKPLRAEIEFEYKHPKAGDVVVEALFTIQEPDRYAVDSDVDYNGFQDLEHFAVFQGGQQIFVDIGDDVLYHHLREYLRNLEIEGCFTTEEEI